MILLVLVGIVLWLPYALNPIMNMQFYDLHPMPLYKPLLSIFQFNPHIGVLLQFACLGLIIFLLSTINGQFRLIEKRSSLYIFLGMLFTAFFPLYQQFNPMMFALLLVLCGLISIFKLYKNERNLQSAYEAGLLFSTAGLIYVNVYALTLIIFLGLIILLPFNWRQWISALFGILTPLIFLFSWLLIFNQFDSFVEILQNNTIDAASTVSFSYLHSAFVVLSSLLFILAFCFVFMGTLVKKVAIQKYYLILVLLVCFILACYVVFPWVGVDIFYFAIVPAVFFIGNYLDNFRRTWFINLISIVLFALTVAAKFM